MRQAVLIYDGECPVCVNAVEWIRGRARPDAFEFLSCRSESLPSRFPAMKKEDCLRAMHLVLPDGTVLAGGPALPEILRRLPRYRWCASLFRLPGALLLAGAFYRWFAKRRHRASGFFFPAGKGRDREIH
jgi:predicted DCC family thiol-disulfide oxidoreductase YuxK